MGQRYPLIRPGLGDNPPLYPPFLALARRGLPEVRILKGHLFFSFLFGQNFRFVLGGLSCCFTVPYPVQGLQVTITPEKL